MSYLATALVGVIAYVVAALLGVSISSGAGAGSFIGLHHIPSLPLSTGVGVVICLIAWCAVVCLAYRLDMQLPMEDPYLRLPALEGLYYGGFFAGVFGFIMNLIGIYGLDSMFFSVFVVVLIYFSNSAEPWSFNVIGSAGAALSVGFLHPDPTLVAVNLLCGLALMGIVHLFHRAMVLSRGPQRHGG